MNWAAVTAVAAIVTIVVSVMGSLAFLIWHAGRHSQRLDRAEGDIKGLTKTQDEHSRLLGGWEQFKDLLNEVRGDVKKLLTEGRRTGAR